MTLPIRLAPRAAALTFVMTALAGGLVLSPGRAAAQVGACVTIGELTLCSNGGRTNPSPLPAPEAVRQPGPYDQNIMITTRNNTRERIVQTFTPNVVSANVTRICLHNRTGGERSMHHSFAGINPLRPASGGTSCANFPANTRVPVELRAAGRAVQPDRAMVWSTTALAGGRLDLVWGG